MSNAYEAALAAGELTPDAVQQAAAAKLHALAQALAPKGFSLFAPPPPKGLYLWGDVGRGKTLLMDLFFQDVELSPAGDAAKGSRRARGPGKQRIHFNAFMAAVHARIHALRGQGGIDDPIAPAAQAIAQKVRLLCLDEFQVTDVADAMILGRLFEQFFAGGMVIVATGNTEPDRLYDGGLNRQLFLPFIEEIKARMEVVALNGPTDYRLKGLKDRALYLTPLGPPADAAMDAAWTKLAGGGSKGTALQVLGRTLAVPRAGRGAARFSFEALCVRALGAADYLALAQNFHTIFIDRIPVMDAAMRNPARRFTLLIDTLYDEGVKLICSAAAPPDGLYVEGTGAQSFRRTASRLVEMQSEDYLAEGHGRRHSRG